MNHFEHLTCNYSAALFVIKLRASIKTCYIDDLMAVAHRDMYMFEIILYYYRSLIIEVEHQTIFEAYEYCINLVLA
jgi:hypothetical protein